MFEHYMYLGEYIYKDAVSVDDCANIFADLHVPGARL